MEKNTEVLQRMQQAREKQHRGGLAPHSDSIFRMLDVDNSGGLSKTEIYSFLDQTGQQTRVELGKTLDRAFTEAAGELERDELNQTQFKKFLSTIDKHQFNRPLWKRLAVDRLFWASILVVVASFLSILSAFLQAWMGGSKVVGESFTLGMINVWLTASLWKTMDYPKVYNNHRVSRHPTNAVK